MKADGLSREKQEAINENVAVMASSIDFIVTNAKAVAVTSGNSECSERKEKL